MNTEKTNTHYVNNKSDIPEKMKSLSKWFTGLHNDYDLSAWCFYGYVGSGSDLLGISLLLQYKNGSYYAAFGLYRPGPTASWSFAGSISETELTVDTPTDGSPWSAYGEVDLPGPGRIRISLLSGAFGQPGAVYQLSADVCSFADLLPSVGSVKYPDLFIDVTIEDVIGAVPIGYGPASFLPNWFTQNEENEIMNSYGGSTANYLSQTNPALTNQGSYYYSSPALKVQAYTIVEWAGEAPFTQTGNSGFLWMDSVVQTFGELNHLPKGATVSWYWFAIPKLTDTQSLAVTQLWYTGVEDMKEFKSASLYSEFGNGFVDYFWNMNDINIQCITKEKQYSVQLLNSSTPVDITLTAIPGDQKLGPAIEGLFKVSGTIGSTPIGGDCYAWGEISLPSTQTRIASKFSNLKK